jgi:hypothetical protein
LFNEWKAKRDSDPAEGIAAALASEFREAMSTVDGMTIDREPSEMKFADRLMRRVDFSGVGLYRSMFVSEIRCHFVSFNLTARTPELLESLARSLSNLSPATGGDPASVPVCIKDCAVADNLLHRVEPVPVGPLFTSIPVRIVIDRDGGVKHVHVIHASDEQRQRIEKALRRWTFVAPRIDGHAVEIETGLMFRFASAQKL